MAELDGVAVGTVGLVPSHQEEDKGALVLDLIKMCVAPEVQGKGMGRALMNAAIAKSREMGATKIRLETNTKLDAALALYRRSGFRELTEEETFATPYCRCNCQMVLDL